MPRRPALRAAARIAYAACALTTSGALAQSLTVTIDGQTAVSVGAGDCSNSHTVQWTASLNGQVSCTPLQMWFTLGTCGTGPDAGDPLVGSPVGSPENLGSGTQTFQTSSEIGGFRSGDGGTLCGGNGAANLTFQLCAAFSYSTSCPSFPTFLTDIPPPTFIFNTLPPQVPSFSLSAGDTTVGVNATDNDPTATSMDVQFAPTPADGGADQWTVLSGVIAPPSSLYTVTGLTDGQSYDFQVRAENSSGTPSDWAPTQSATPILTFGFFAHYAADGGQERGGCSGVPGLVPWLAVSAAQWFLRKRRRARAGESKGG